MSLDYGCVKHKIRICKCYGELVMQLEVENKRYREALEHIGNHGYGGPCTICSSHSPIRIAKQALKGESNEADETFKAAHEKVIKDHSKTFGKLAEGKE